MAGVRICRNLRRNPLPSSKNELARGLSEALIKGSNTSTLFSPDSWAQTFALALPLAPASSFTKKLYQPLLKTYIATVKLLEQNHEPGCCKEPFKAWFPDLYYRNLHMNCYCFCQQCEDYFKTIKANGPNHIPFAALFLCGAVVQH